MFSTVLFTNGTCWSEGVSLLELVGYWVKTKGEDEELSPDQELEEGKLAKLVVEKMIKYVSFLSFFFCCSLLSISLLYSCVLLLFFVFLSVMILTMVLLPQ